MNSREDIEKLKELLETPRERDLSQLKDQLQRSLSKLREVMKR